VKIDIKANRRRRSYRECGAIGSFGSSESTQKQISQQVAASEGSTAFGAGALKQGGGGITFGANGSSNQVGLIVASIIAGGMIFLFILVWRDSR
jgi:hypothetical protein